MIADDPNNADALNSFGYMLAERGQKLDEAVAFVQRALAIEPGNGAYLDSLGWAYYKQNRLDQAEAPLREAAAQLPTVLGHSGSSRRSPEQARPVRGSDRRLAEGARRRWRVHLALGDRRQDQIGAPETWPKKVSSPFRFFSSRSVWRRADNRACDAAGRRRHAGAGFCAGIRQARAACDSVRTLQAELGLSGRAAGQRMRGRVLAGLVPGALRLEGVAPFGAPVFILVADGARGTLLLSRERRVVQDAPPEEILNALVGIRLGADDLRAMLSGCVKAAAEPTGARAYGADWLAVDLAAGGTVYLRRIGNAWRIVAGRYGGLEIDYAAFQGDRPSQVVLRGAGSRASRSRWTRWK